VCRCMCVHTPLSVYASLCMCIQLPVCIYLCVYILGSAYAWMCICLSYIWQCIHLGVHEHVCMYLCVCAPVHTCGSAPPMNTRGSRTATGPCALTTEAVPSLPHWTAASPPQPHLTCFPQAPASLTLLTSAGRLHWCWWVVRF
jgi:hypothetical protein